MSRGQIPQRQVEGLASALAGIPDDERIRDVVGTALVAGANVSISVNDAGDTITIAATDTNTTDPEVVRDTIGSALVAGANVSISVNDAGDTITISSTDTTDPEVVRDTIGATLVAGANVTISVDDVANTITINASPGGGGTDPEVVRDTIGGALVAGANVSITVNDAGDTITIAATDTNTTDPEVVRDTMAAALVAGSGISIVSDDPGDTITISATGAGGVGSDAVVVRAYATASQIAAHATWTSAAFTNESFDTDGFHDNATNNTRFTVPAGKGGKYLLAGSISFASDGTGTGARYARILKNGVDVYGTAIIPPLIAQMRVPVTAVLDLVPGDYLELQGRQTSGAGLEIGDTTGAGTAGETWFSMVKIGGAGAGTLPAFRGAKAAAASQSIASGSVAPLSLTTEEYDTDNIHDNTTNPTRFTIPAGMGGVWRFTGTVSFASSASATGRAIFFLVNGVNTMENGGTRLTALSSVQNSVSSSVDLLLNAGDYVELAGLQSTGSALAVTGRLSCAFLGSSTGGASGSLPRARAYLSPSNLTLTTGTTTTIPLGAEDYDTDALHDVLTNDSRITLNKSGVWIVTGLVAYGGSATGRRIVNVAKNGVTQVTGSGYPTTTAVAYVPVSGFLTAVAGDYLELTAYQDTGANLAVFAGNGNTYLAASYVGP